MRLNILSKFQDLEIARGLLKRINQFKEDISLMEVCGTHTVQIFKTGIRAGLNKNIKLLSGPGCPVCVTTSQDIDKAIAIATSLDVILCCFGDMLSVPGSNASLDSVEAHIKIMYSPMEALELAEEMPDKKIVMFGIGFETTVPAFSSVLVRAKKQNIKNLYIFPVFKLIPPAIRALLESKEINPAPHYKTSDIVRSGVNIDGFILPGHVSSVIGENQYHFIAEEFGRPAVITGFESVDILGGILLLLEMIKNKKPAVKIEYRRSVQPQGNKLAQDMIYKVFQKSDAQWRGLGKIKNSGLRLKDEFNDFCIDRVLDIKIKPTQENPNCICSSIIMGAKGPLDCRLYAKKCTPEYPLGPCMVSAEGTCAAYYKYGENKEVR
jgi:hydrogenase expression/formation protein HypD